MTQMKAAFSSKELRQFLGAVNFYRLFFPGCLGRADPLFELI